MEEALILVQQFEKDVRLNESLDPCVKVHQSKAGGALVAKGREALHLMAGYFETQPPKNHKMLRAWFMLAKVIRKDCGLDNGYDGNWFLMFGNFAAWIEWVRKTFPLA